jgi:L-malate glycosyltransferase
MPDFATLLEQIRPDLIHAGPVQSCGFMAAMAGCHPLMVMSWGSDILVDADRDEMSRWVTRYTLSRSEMLVCDCQAVRAKVQQWVDYPDERVVQFPWGIDLHRFETGPASGALRNRPGWKDGRIILSTRSWEPIYGIDILLKAFQQAHSENPNLRLVLMGDGSLAGSIHQFIREHHLDRVIYRPGMVSHAELPEYFRATDLYVTCSYSDGTSISLLEALASGLPVVVTDAPGNREWVVPGENGWLASPGSADAFARAMLHAAGLGAGERLRIARNNRQVAEERANWDANVARLLDAYDRMEAAYVR